MFVQLFVCFHKSASWLKLAVSKYPGISPLTDTLPKVGQCFVVLVEWFGSGVVAKLNLVLPS